VKNQSSCVYSHQLAEYWLVHISYGLFHVYQLLTEWENSVGSWRWTCIGAPFASVSWGGICDSTCCWALDFVY